MWFSLALVISSSISLADQPERPLRPTTHPGDPALSEGNLVNFQRLYVDPDTVAEQLIPSQAIRNPEGKSLAVINKTTGWTDVTISGVQIGRIPPLTTAIIHGVKPGTYTVEQSVENTQYSFTEMVKTSKIEGIITPGNAKASIAATPEYVKPVFDTQEPPIGGQLAPYTFPNVGQSINTLSGDDQEQVLTVEE